MGHNSKNPKSPKNKEAAEASLLNTKVIFDETNSKVKLVGRVFKITGSDTNLKVHIDNVSGRGSNKYVREISKVWKC